MINTDSFDYFDRFQKHLPIESDRDLTLTILKGHLLIEEQVWLLIRNRVPSYKALEKAQLTSNQRLCLAEALIDEFTRKVQQPKWLWPALKKLNKLRNDIAHELTPSGMEDRVKDFIGRVPNKLGSINICQEFQFALFNACAEVHQLIEPVTPQDFY